LSTHTSPLALRSARISISTRGSCRRALLEFKVVVFRDQRIDAPNTSRSVAARFSAARVFASKLAKKAEELHEKFPPVEHPMVRTHPETGRRLIYVNLALTDRIKGLTPKESSWLLDHLYQATKNADIQCRFRWQPGALAFWDNRSCQHFAASDHFPQRRVMERATIAGDRP
jgi:taurine dioxygenase